MINYNILFLLGAVDSLLEDGNLKVSYFTWTDKIGSWWLCPEEFGIQGTSVDQVPSKVDNVRYQCITRVHCFVDKQVTTA